MWYNKNMDNFFLVLLYLEGINLVSFVLMGMTARRERQKRNGLPAVLLLFFAAVGGSVGAMAGRWLFHACRRDERFAMGLPLLLVMQVVLVLFFLWVWSA